MPVEIRTLGPDDISLLESVSLDVFDGAIQPRLAREFLADDRHHIVVAIDSAKVVGFASGIHYLHPDKEAELFANELGVSKTHRRLGIAKRLVGQLLNVARSKGCWGAWVLTHVDNQGARKFYESIGGAEEQTHSVLYELPIGDTLTS